MSPPDPAAPARAKVDRADGRRGGNSGSPSGAGALADVAALVRSGDLGAAENLCRRIERETPGDPRVLDALGGIAYRRGDPAKAIEAMSRAVALDPSKAAYHAHHGTALAAAGRHEDAVAALRRALDLRPGSASTWFNLGGALKRLRRTDEAVAAFRRSAAIDPAFHAAFHALAVTLKDAGRLDEAASAFREAVGIGPGALDSRVGLGDVLRRAGRLDDAVAAYAEATGIAPDCAPAHRGLGLALMRRKDYGPAVDALRRALDIDPSDVAAWCYYANACVGRSRMEDAVAGYTKALELAPGSATARLGLCMARLPIIYGGEDEIDERRAAYRRELESLGAYFSGQSADTLAKAANAVGAVQPFFLAYQGRVDRDLQALYGELVCRLMAAAYPRWSTPLPMPEPDPDGRIRVGIVSGFFHWHSNWKIPIRGWAEHLDRRRFRVFGYYTRTRQDSATRHAESLFDRFERGPRAFSEWCETIRRDAPHVLIFPEIGMDPMTARLAALRLAPVQCSSWGHPNTSGYPTIDYFLSSDLMEPPGAERHYTETLVRLPNLSIHYTPPPVAAAALTRADLGVREGSVVYWCCQSLFKYLPRHDDIFPRIARQAGDCQFVFLRHGSNWVTDTFRARLERAFAAHGLAWDRYCVLSDRLDPARFAGAMRIADVFLDSVGWSGCNTTLEAFAAGLPAVTCRGQTMRARHTAAMLEMIGLADCIAETVDAYVTLAARMGRDPAWRSEIAKTLIARRDRAYNDRACIEGLEAFLLRVAGNGSPLVANVDGPLSGVMQPSPNPARDGGK
jgi:predicted O-linked N-acetylglucosamine transferase (SPINDLY family)